MSKVKTTLTNISENKILTNEYSATIKKNKITYHNDINKETIYIKDKKIILSIETPEHHHTINFEKGKTIPSSYYAKPLDMYLNIDILTKELTIEKDYIKIEYELPDNNNKFIYEIEMR